MKSPWKALQQVMASVDGLTDLVLATFAVLTAWVVTDILRTIFG